MDFWLWAAYVSGLVSIPTFRWIADRIEDRFTSKGAQ